jgi:DNA-binding transcriptional MerR regulator
MSVSYAETAGPFLLTQARQPSTRENTAKKQVNEKNWLTISEMADRYNTTLRTLRFYEQRGLLQPERRGTQRLYDQNAEQRFRLIEQARKLDFTLTEIADILASSPSDAALVLSKARIREQIGYLETRYQEINDALGELRRRYYLMSEPADPQRLQAAGNE